MRRRGESDASAVLVVILLGFLLLCLCFAGCYAGSKFQVSDGYRDVTVRKVSHTGIINKTWEVDTLDAVQLQPQTFQFTVDDPAVLDQLRALPPTKRVRLHYTRSLTAWQPNGETPYRITRIEELKP